MLPKSSERVAEVIKVANQIAREYDQEYVGTEHLLLAIQREGTGIGATVLAKRGIAADRLRAEVDKLVKKQLEETWVFGRLPGTPHFKNVMASGNRTMPEAQFAASVYGASVAGVAQGPWVYCPEGAQGCRSYV